jgi:hypothetical protein
METAKVFSTMDLYLAAFLALKNVEPKIEVIGDKAVFTFDTTDELYRVMSLYNFNQEVPAADFVTRIKALRGQMLTVKGSITGQRKGDRYGQSKY